MSINCFYNKKMANEAKHRISHGRDVWGEPHTTRKGL